MWPSPFQRPTPCRGRRRPVLLPHAPDSWLDVLFQAAAEATEQAVFKALFLAEPIVGREGRRRLSIREALPEWREIVGKEALCAF
nr:P1 family peptidase [uncultured Bilophila sp.]